MTDYPFNFDREAALAAMLYVAERVPGLTKLHLSKILYFADKAHLEEWGRLITGDQYVAMPKGPVPSQILDLMNTVDQQKTGAALFPPDMAQHIEIRYVQGLPAITALHEADLDALSDSDIACLDAAIEKYGHITDGRIMSELSHDLSWQATPENKRIPVENLVISFNNREDVLEHLRNPNP